MKRWAHKGYIAEIRVAPGASSIAKIGHNLPSCGPTTPVARTEPGSTFMFGPYLVVAPLLAQAPAPAAEPSGPAQLLTYLPLIAAVSLFIFMTARGQQQDQKKRKSMLDALKRNDKVLTSAGLYGTVVALDPENDRVTLRISEEGNVRVVFARAGIVKVIEPAEKK